MQEELTFTSHEMATEHKDIGRKPVDIWRKDNMPDAFGIIVLITFVRHCRTYAYVPQTTSHYLHHN